jgi:hypothetical protein
MNTAGGHAGAPSDLGTSAPIQRRPAAITEPELRHQMLTLYGRLLHKEHEAEKRSESGDAHSRDHWRAVAAAHRADAESVAVVLGIGQGTAA